MDDQGVSQADRIARDWQRSRRPVLARIVGGTAVPTNDRLPTARPALEASGAFAVGIGLDFLLIALLGRAI